jgi:hypothetical protein
MQTDVKYIIAHAAFFKYLKSIALQESMFCEAFVDVFDTKSYELSLLSFW